MRSLLTTRYICPAQNDSCALWLIATTSQMAPVFLWGVMGYGNWGEWHVLESHYPWPNVETKHQVLSNLVDFYADTYKNNPLVIAYCFDADNEQVTSLPDFLYRQGLDEAIKRHFALERRGFIDG